jgi:hypothetical protein
MRCPIAPACRATTSRTEVQMLLLKAWSGIYAAFQ